MDIEKQIPRKNYFDQPQFHQDKMNLCEKYCCTSFFGIIKDNNLTQEEIVAYYNIKKIAILQFNTNDHNHENLLALLYYNAFGFKLEDENLPRWKELGFQVKHYIKHCITLCYVNLLLNSLMIQGLTFGLEVCTGLYLLIILFFIMRR